MATNIPFPGSREIGPSPQHDPERVGVLHYYSDGERFSSPWVLSEEELAIVLKTGMIWVSSLSGHTTYPMSVEVLPPDDILELYEG